MSETREPNCPECGAIDRRDLLRYVSIAPAAIAAGAMMSPSIASAAEPPAPREVKANPGGELVKELYASMSDKQKEAACKPWTHQARLSVNPNRALDKTIGNVFDKKQQELIERIVKSISAGDDKSWTQITRNGTWDASKTFANTGADIFGDPTTDQYAFLFTGHHLTLRLDNNMKDGMAFGGPIYYGHTPAPYTDKNVFYYQTQQAMKFFDALDKDQRERAIIKKGNPGEGAGSIKLPGTAKGVMYADLSADQKELMGLVMRSLLSPFRKEDADEAMAVIKKSGGMEKLGFVFYNDKYGSSETSEKQPWTFWRIEGPGIVWNFRVLEHVHTFVSIKAPA